MNTENRPLDWLLESSIPSIRYRTLTRLMGRGEDDAWVVESRRAVMEQGPVPAILARQTERGDWAGEHSFYTPKYTSTHWAMLLLDELGADGSDPRLKRGTEFMLDAYLPWNHRSRFPESRFELECLYGNILHYSARCGLGDDPRAVQIVDYLAKCALQGGWVCPYNAGEPCAWGAARALWGLAAVPSAARSDAAQAAVQSGLRLLLEEHSLAEVNYPVGRGKVNALWQSLNFPLFYQADILFVLRVLAELGQLTHPGAQPALVWLAARSNAGRFRGTSPFRQRTYRQMGAPEETQRWVTLQALEILAAG